MENQTRVETPAERSRSHKHSYTHTHMSTRFSHPFVWWSSTHKAHHFTERMCTYIVQVEHIRRREHSVCVCELDMRE